MTQKLALMSASWMWTTSSPFRPLGVSSVMLADASKVGVISVSNFRIVQGGHQSEDNDDEKSDKRPKVIDAYSTWNNIMKTIDDRDHEGVKQQNGHGNGDISDHDKIPLETTTATKIDNTPVDLTADPTEILQDFGFFSETKFGLFTDGAMSYPPFTMSPSPSRSPSTFVSPSRPPTMPSARPHSTPRPPTSVPTMREPTISPSPQQEPSTFVSPSRPPAMPSARPHSTPRPRTSVPTMREPTISPSPQQELSSQPSLADGRTQPPSREPSQQTNSSNPTSPTVNPASSLVPRSPTRSPTPSATLMPTLSPSRSAQPSKTPRPVSATTAPSPTFTVSPTQLVPTSDTSKAPTASSQTPQAPTTPSPVASTPTIRPSPTLDPASKPLTPTRNPASASPTADLLVFACTELGVVLATPPYDQTPITIRIKVGYLLESLFFVSDFLEELQNKILETSIASALGCNEGGPLFGPSGTAPLVSIITAFTGIECQSEISICTTLETEFEFAVVDQELRSADSAAFLSYIALQENMDGFIFGSEISELDRMEYLSPLPLIPLIEDPIIEASPSSDLSLSPYTLGAVVAMSVVGLVALSAWARNRSTRNNRHMALIESMSIDTPQGARTFG
ncbi:hypothetical protein ACA910_003229 [Epithemia clementina (nom. ined.)]